MWPFSLLSNKKWIAVAIVAVLAASAYGVVYLRGYQSHKNKTDIKELKSEVTIAHAQVKQLEDQRSENASTVVALSADKARDKSEFRRIRVAARNIDRAIVTDAVEASQPIAATAAVSGSSVCTVSAEYVRVWNDAVSLPDTTDRAAAAVADAGDVEVEASIADLLDNHIENAERSRANWQQCNALIDWHRRNDRKDSTP